MRYNKETDTNHTNNLLHRAFYLNVGAHIKMFSVVELPYFVQFLLTTCAMSQFLLGGILHAYNNTQAATWYEQSMDLIYITMAVIKTPDILHDILWLNMETYFLFIDNYKCCYPV